MNRAQRTTLVFCLVACALAVALRQPVSAQQFTVRGQITEAGRADNLIAAASITLADRPAVLSDANGRFRINNVPPGRYPLSVRALGYATAELTLVVSRDTTLQIALEVSPIEVNPLQVQARQVRVRGVVKEKASGIWLIDALVTAADRKDRADPIGRFNLGKFPSGIPVTLNASNFGYMPASVTLTPDRDTSVVVELEHDAVMQKMIAVQHERMDARAEGRRFRILPVIERDELLKDLNSSVLEVINRKLGPMASKQIVCLIVDEKPFSWRADVMMPDRVDRVEIIEYPGTMRRALGVRVYTRNFLVDLIGGHSELLPKERTMVRIPSQCH